MKNKIIAITGLSLVIGLLGWSNRGESNSLNPKDSPFANKCSSNQGTDAFDLIEYDMCCIDYNEAIAAAERDWDNNLKALLDQEIPASQMVDDAYENLRTYNCWLEYICLGVQYSGFAPIESGLGTGLTSKHLGQVPGCQLPENLTLEDNFNNFTEGMKEVPVLGTTADSASNLYTTTKINYFPACMSDANNNKNPRVDIANANFNACKATIEEKFGCSEDLNEVDLKECMESATAIVKMETSLKQRHAEQKATALERKLSSIAIKLSAMEAHVGYFSNFLEQLDARFSCYAEECT